METLATPLDEEEIELLDEFLLGRVDEESLTADMDEGIFEISGLDGFLTAIVSGPVTVMPSAWLPAVWGDFEPVWESAEDAEFFLSLIMRHMNGIAATLLTEPRDFEPICYERQVGGRPVLVVDEWCEGYIRGVGLAAEAWAQGGEEVAALLTPIRAFTEAGEWTAHDLDSEQEFNSLQDAVARCAREIHGYWLERRTEHPERNVAVRRTAARIGGNDPCPCGSGRKFRHCCMN